MPRPHPRLTKQANAKRHQAISTHPAHPSAVGERITKATAIKRINVGHGTENRHTMLDRLQAQGRIDGATGRLLRADGSPPPDRS